MVDVTTDISVGTNDVFLLLSGMKVVNEVGTFYFSEPGNWLDYAARPIYCKLHRENGPAAEYNDGTKFWHINGQLHRTDGPAVEYPDGKGEWWEHGRLVDGHRMATRMNSTPIDD